MSPEDALVWLENDDGEAAEEFRGFRTRNAHRCYKEFDVYAKTWDIDPMPLVKTLQSNVRGDEQPPQESRGLRLTVDELPVIPSFLRRKMLRYFIRKAQFAIFIREATKSALVKFLHKIRLGLRNLGQKLLDEGRLADPELVFFLTCDELYRFITTKDPTLVQR